MARTTKAAEVAHLGYTRLHRLVFAATGCATTGALLLSACAPDPAEQAGGDVPAVALPNLQLAAALVPFDACDDLLDHVKAEALERVGPYGLDGGGWWGGPVPLAGRDRVTFETVGGEISAADGAAAPQSSPSENFRQFAGEETGDDDGGGDTPSFSTTNVQEEGVDEPDLVKTDGERIVTVAGDRLLVLLGAADQPEVVGDVRLPGWGGQLLLHGDTALVIVNDASTDDVRVMRDDGPGRVAGPDIMPAPEGTRLVQVDLGDPTAPRITDEVAIGGQHVATRMIGDTARVVVRSSPRQLEFVYPSGPAAEEAAEDANRAVIEASTLDDWMPTHRGSSGGAEQLLSCDAVSHPKEFSGFTTVSVLTFDVGDGFDQLGAVGVLADAQHVYASSSSLYVATNDYVEPGTIEDAPAMRRVDETFRTDLHKFDLTGDGPARYRASGEVDGHLLNQFSLSERDGVLRVATTDGSPWGCCGETTSESFVTTFTERGGELVQLASVGGLGKGEQIYAVRFVGDVGYVVTFRQTDPLYVVDLRDPARPAVTGELKIPGYSAYLHPIGNGLLLGVGQDGTDDGRLTGSAVSLFDVSDPTDPQRIAMEPLGGGSSAVEFDHHAFLWWAPENLAVLPLSTYGPDGEFTGAIGLRVDGRTIERVLQVVNDSNDLRPRPEPEPDPDATTTTEAPPTTIEPTTTTEPDTTVPDGTTTIPDSVTTIAPPTTALPATSPPPELEEAPLSSVAAESIAPEPYPNRWAEPIQRSFVVGDLLYTWSQRGLAVTWLPTLEKIDWVSF